MARTYTCSVCGNTYESGWSEEDAAAEYQQNFGAVLADEDANVVCDDCYKQFMSWSSAVGLDLHSRDELELEAKIIAHPEEHHALRYGKSPLMDAIDDALDRAVDENLKRMGDSKKGQAE